MKNHARRAVHTATAILLFAAGLEALSWLALKAIDAANEFAAVYSYMRGTSYGTPLLKGSFRIDPELGWDSVSSVRGRELKASGKRYFAAIFGDSMTYGWEVEYPQSWGYLLEKKLGREILNMGVNGYGADQSLLKFEKYAASFPSEYAVLGILPDDISRLLMRMPNLRWRTSDPPFLKPRFKLSGKGLVLVPNPLKDVSEYSKLLDPEYLAGLLSEDGYYLYHRESYGFDMARGRRFPFTRELFRSAYGLARYGRANRWWGSPPQEFYREGSEAYALMKEIVSEFRRKCSAAGSTPIIMLHCDSRSDLYGAGYLDGLIRHIKNEGILFVNVRDLFLPELQKRNVSVGELLAPGGHYSPLANYIIAGKLAGFFSLLSRRDTAGAAAYLETAAGVKVNYCRGHYLAGLSHLGGGECTKPDEGLALAHCEKAVSLDPGDPAAHTALGKVHAFSGRPAKARAAYLKALSLAPGYKEALAGIERLPARPGGAKAASLWE